MNQFEKNLYNTFLKTTREAQGKPWKARRNFEDFEDNDQYVYLKKVVNFFNKFSQVDPVDYFDAPYKVYDETDTYYDLKFYSSQKAIKAYSIYKKELENELPDSPQQIKFMTDSLRFMAQYCHKNKINIKDYITHTENNVLTFAKHYKNRQVSIYALLEFPDIEQVIYKLPQDEQQLFFGDLIKNLTKFKIRYHKSEKAKNIGHQFITKIQEILKK